MSFDPTFGNVPPPQRQPQRPAPQPPQGQPYGVAPGQPYGVAPGAPYGVVPPPGGPPGGPPPAQQQPAAAPIQVHETYGVAPPLDQVFAAQRPPARSGILTALGVFALLASIGVPVALALVVNLTVAGCDSEGWSYPVCTDGSQGTLGVLYPLVAALVAFIASTRAIANAKARPLRACIWLAFAAIVLVLLLAVVPSSAGVPFFGW